MPTYREEVAERIAPLLAPLAGASPAGADISYDADFEVIKAEIDKLSSVDNLEPAWGRIEQLAATLLAQKGKDLRVVSWMTVAKVKTSSWKGFAESLVLCHGLAKRVLGHDVSGGPPRACARQRDRVDGRHGQPAHGVQGRHAGRRRRRAHLRRGPQRSSIASSRTSSATPTWAPVSCARSCAARCRRSPRLPPNRRRRAGLDPSPPRSCRRPRLSRLQRRRSRGDRRRARGQQPRHLRVRHRPAGRRRERAWAYALQRRGAWLIVQQTPGAQDGRTVIPPPDGGVIAELTELHDGQKWAELLAAAEAQTSNYLFWLDLHRFVAVAMDNLGPQYLAAREAVGRAVASFVSSMTDIAALTFSDGTAFADTATQNWLAEEPPGTGAAGAVRPRPLRSAPKTRRSRIVSRRRRRWSRAARWPTDWPSASPSPTARRMLDCASVRAFRWARWRSTPRSPSWPGGCSST